MYSPPTSVKKKKPQSGLDYSFLTSAELVIGEADWVIFKGQLTKFLRLELFFGYRYVPCLLVLSYRVILFCFSFQYSSNRMNLQNIGIVLSPTMNVGHGVLFIFLNYVNELFPDTKITK